MEAMNEAYVRWLNIKQFADTSSRAVYLEILAILLMCVQKRLNRIGYNVYESTVKADQEYRNFVHSQEQKTRKV